MISLQDIFNAAWKAFIIEKKPPAVGESGTCFYYYAGNKCAIGLVLPNNNEKGSYCGTFSEIVEEDPNLFDETIQDNDSDFLDNFQQELHDDIVKKGDNDYVWALSPDSMESHYRKIAARYNLIVPE